MLSRLRSRRLLAVLGALIVLLAVGAYAAYRIVLDDPGDISNPDVEFVEPTATATPEPGEKGKKKKRKPFKWPRYGFTKDHNRNYDPGYRLEGPFTERWKRGTPALAEFPPVMEDGRLYQIVDNGLLRAYNARNGKILWKRDLGKLSASSPAIEDGRIYVTLLQGPGGGSRGRVVSLNAKNGKVRWARTLPSRSESSPLIHDEKVYFGSENGTVYALWANRGSTAWTYRANGAVKGSPTLGDDGNLYFGDYGGYVHAVRAQTGRRVWSSGAARRALRGGRFYATAAVAYGRVFIGATDGRQYSLSARSGRIAWARQTGNYVYSSAAIKTVRGKGPTVFFGSYDGRLYALDARSGRTRWTFRSGGKISGSPTIVGTAIYFSDLGKARTYGLNVASGKRVFTRDYGGYDPIISDGRDLYLTGRHSLAALRARNAPDVESRREPQGRGKSRNRARDRVRDQKAQERKQRKQRRKKRRGRRDRR